MILGLNACGTNSNGPDGSAESNPASSSTTSSVSNSNPASDGATSSDPAAACLDYAGELSLAQQVGQLYMTVLMADSSPDDVIAQIGANGNGAVILLGNRTGGLSAVQAETSQLQEFAPGGVPLLIATDQEGGLVQKLAGPGFDTIPSATEQAVLSGDELRTNWQAWGGQLAQAGVNWNLAPVADVVPADQVGDNAAIGQLNRGYGSDAAMVGDKVTQVIAGLSDAQVASSVKHFPGLGQVNANTDFEVGYDRVSTLSADELTSFQAAIDAGASSVMVSSAVYEQVDPDNPAVFSSQIVTGVLRDQMGFDGVVISDDLGVAAAVSGYPVAERGTDFFKAGGDMAVVADGAAAQQMLDATLAEAQGDAEFASEITKKTARVLQLKSDLGLMSCTV